MKSRTVVNVVYMFFSPVRRSRASTRLTGPDLFVPEYSVVPDGHSVLLVSSLRPENEDRPMSLVDTLFVVAVVFVIVCFVY